MESRKGLAFKRNNTRESNRKREGRDRAQQVAGIVNTCGVVARGHPIDEGVKAFTLEVRDDAPEGSYRKRKT